MRVLKGNQLAGLLRSWENMDYCLQVAYELHRKDCDQVIQEIRIRPAMLPARALLRIQSWLILFLAVSLVVLFDFSLTEAASRKIACGGYSIHLAAGSTGKGGDSLQIGDGKGTLAYQLVGNRIELSPDVVPWLKGQQQKIVNLLKNPPVYPPDSRKTQTESGKIQTSK